MLGKSAVTLFELGVLTKVNSMGLLVTMLEPFGKNSLPTMDSSTEDLPDDCEPITTIDGKVKCAEEESTLFKIVLISIICLVKFNTVFCFSTHHLS